ncbi:ERMES complex subunit [Podila horticola]|nr:ERMES complex subunit [Podila horticola]
MAFRFQWPYFSEEFIQEAKTMLTNALNKGNKPAVIVDHITVKELDMGTLPPELEMLEMGELSMERFRGIFKLTYNGDAHIVLQTKVQANPMNVKKTDNPSYTRRGILAADQPLVVPMLLRISDFKLRGIIVLVVDQIKGITLVFKNDPLESVLVSSTFDSITPIQKFLQSEIEKQLRNLFQEDLPTAIHNLSQQFTKKSQDVPRQQHHHVDDSQRPGIYDGGLGTPMVSQNPSRRSSTKPGPKKTPGKPNSVPDLSSGAHYEDGLNSVRKPASATMQSGSPGSSRPSSRGKGGGGGRDPHTEYTGDTNRDLLEESLKHPANAARSQSGHEHRRTTNDRYGHSSTSATSTLERLSMKEEIQSSLGIAESTHLANQFANLIHSNQTISPYAQNLEHFAFRSVPPKRPASVQYYTHSQYGMQSPGIRSATNSVTDVEVSSDGLTDPRNRPRGQSVGQQHYRQDMGVHGHGQSSPRVSHRRMTGRVGIRRYAMQMGAGNGPRQLSDYDSDEYNDVDEALSESEYVYVEKAHARPSTEMHQDASLLPLSQEPGSPTSSLQTIGGSSGIAAEAPSGTRPHLSRRPSSSSTSSSSSSFRQVNSSYPATATMPGGFSSSADSKSWHRSRTSEESGHHSRFESRTPPIVTARNSSTESELQKEFASLKLKNKQQQQQQSNSSLSIPTPSLSSSIPSHLNGNHKAFSSTINHNNSTRPATARTFSSTQQRTSTSSQQQQHPKFPPPESLKRDKRNSSILSSRRVSSAGIGLGVLSKDSVKSMMTAGKTTGSPRHRTGEEEEDERSFYKRPSQSSGWFELDST